MSSLRFGVRATGADSARSGRHSSVPVVLLDRRDYYGTFGVVGFHSRAR